MVIEGAFAHAGGGADLRHAGGIIAVAREQIERHLEQAGVGGFSAGLKGQRVTWI